MPRYDFLLDTYDTERLKTLSVWSQLRDLDHLLTAEARGGEEPPLPGPGEKSPTERPNDPPRHG